MLARAGALALILALAAAGIARATIVSWKISGDLPDFGLNRAYAISPDGKYVVYDADVRVDQMYELFSVPILGGEAPVPLNPPLVNGGMITGFTITPDSQFVVYRVDLHINDHFELYAVPITGGEAVRLDEADLSDCDVEDFQITPDSQRVVYRADQESNDEFELYMVAGFFGISALLRRTQTGTLTADARIGHWGDFIIAAQIVQTYKKLFNVAANIAWRSFPVAATIKAARTSSFGIAAEKIPYGATRISASSYLDALILGPIPSSFTIDAVIRVAGGSFALEADIKGQNEQRGLFNMSAVLGLKTTKTFVIDGVVNPLGQWRFFIDAWIQPTFTIAGYIVLGTGSASPTRNRNCRTRRASRVSSDRTASRFRAASQTTFNLTWIFFASRGRFA